MFSELNLNAADLIPLWAFRFVDVKESKSRFSSWALAVAAPAGSCFPFGDSVLPRSGRCVKCDMRGR